MQAANAGTSLKRLLVFIATYNEIENVRALLEAIWHEIPHADVLAIDDHSPDKTGNLLDEIAQSQSQLTVIHRPRKLGLGTAHHLAMIYAIKHQYDTLITMDADHSHHPADIPRLLEKLTDFDFVIGSRYMRGGGCDYHGYRKFLSVSANFAARLLLGIPLHEFTTSFRAFRVRALANVNFVKMHNQGYSFFMESVYRFKQADLRLAEIPIYFSYRNAGISKIPRLEILRGMFKLFHLVGSRILGHTISNTKTLIEDQCAHCRSPFFSEYYPHQIMFSKEKESHAFDCSRMEHNNKSYLIKCLQCGFIQSSTREHSTDLENLFLEYHSNNNAHDAASISSVNKIFQIPFMMTLNIPQSVHAVFNVQG